jgi:hypothetical protein
LSNPLIDEQIYDEFLKSGKMVTAYAELDRAFYWSAGKYHLTINTTCINPIKIFSKSFNFEISTDDERNLRLNSLSVLRLFCGFTPQWYFAYPEYGEYK